MTQDMYATYEWWEAKKQKVGWKISLRRSELDHLQRRVVNNIRSETFKGPIFEAELTLHQALHLAYLEWNVAVPEVGEFRRDPRNPTNGPMTTATRKVQP